ncbi:MAG: hypothetical protein JWM57_4256 [Phycisphaerales bacterium]|nr:hypothetical protein [Phycisphaerales bacterium]
MAKTANTSTRKAVKKIAKKTAKKVATTPAAAPPGPSTAPTDAVRVRMYRQGLGDCFLLSFPRDGGGRPVFMLIDCGVILGTPNPTPMMHRVAESILQETGGQIDIVVATHQHYDHLSGFLQAADVFDKIKIDTLWLAWTEDDADPLAKRLRNERNKTKTALRMALTRLKADGGPGVADRVQSLLGFFGPSLAAGAKKDQTDLALEWLRDRAGKIKFWKPGIDPIPLPGATDVKVFMLGPPHDDATIHHSDPSAKEKRDNVVYQLGGALGGDMGFFSAVLGVGLSKNRAVLVKQPMDDLDAPDLTRPFDDCHGMPPTKLKAADDQFFRTHYHARGQSWRRIDGDWLNVGAELALKLDSDTNNTSLAMAIELPGGRVMLFPADAQVGNWTSWQDYTWIVDGKPVTIRDLLARTVLYKVGHHGSHNATLRVGGLESMGSDFVAMLPVDEEVAHDIKKWMSMPLPALVARLNERTQGRVMRIDKDLPTKQPAGLSASGWAAFKKATKGSTDLYTDYVLPPE